MAAFFRRKITVRDLLTMSTGIHFNEVGTVLEKDWVYAFLDSNSSFEPGTQFEYNSLNSYMLAAIVPKGDGTEPL